MRYMKLSSAIVLCILLFIGCAGKTSLVKFIKEGGLETKGLVNLALASNGARIVVSKENPDHPASTLNNGITSSENWDQGEGWEVSYEGRFARGRYLAYGVEDPYLAEERGFNESFDTGDPSWRGLTMRTARGDNINTSLGWVIIELPEEKTVNRAIVYTIDSEKYPAEKYGVSDLLLQYWSDAVNSWVTVERLGKGKGQTGNTIENNKSQVITFRFQPIETRRIRLAIRWTNDSKRYSRGYYTYASGTTRLVEIEVFGYERSDEEAPEVAAANVVQDANKVAEIEIVIDNYVDGYNKKNTDMLMSSISPDYSKDGETYSDLRKRMESLFADYEQVQLELDNLQIKLTDKESTATSSYVAKLQTTTDDPQPNIASGTLAFQLSENTGFWKITRIDTQ